MDAQRAHSPDGAPDRSGPKRPAVSNALMVIAVLGVGAAVLVEGAATQVARPSTRHLTAPLQIAPQLRTRF